MSPNDQRLLDNAIVPLDHEQHYKSATVSRQGLAFCLDYYRLIHKTDTDSMAVHPEVAALIEALMTRLPGLGNDDPVPFTKMSLQAQQLFTKWVQRNESMLVTSDTFPGGATLEEWRETSAVFQYIRRGEQIAESGFLQTV